MLHRILANTSELHVHELGKSRGASVKTQFSKCVVVPEAVMTAFVELTTANATQESKLAKRVVIPLEVNTRS